MIAFVVPVHGRHALAEACLRQLRRVCDRIDATAVIVGAEPLFRRLAGDLEFDYLQAANQPLGRKWNDAYEHALRRLDADYVVPLGSDDIVHPDYFAVLPGPGQVRCSRLVTAVSPDGRRMALLRVPYEGGCGVRIFPRALLMRVGGRPADDRKDRAIDGSITDHLNRVARPERVYHDTDALQLIDFKTHAPDQRTRFAPCLIYATGERTDVWDAIADRHGPEVAEEVAAVYGRQAVAA